MKICLVGQKSETNPLILMTELLKGSPSFFVVVVAVLHISLET